MKSKSRGLFEVNFEVQFCQDTLDRQDMADIAGRLSTVLITIATR